MCRPAGAPRLHVLYVVHDPALPCTEFEHTILLRPAFLAHHAPFLAHHLDLRTTYRHSSRFGLSTSVFRLVLSACPRLLAFANARTHVLSARTSAKTPICSQQKKQSRRNHHPDPIVVAERNLPVRTWERVFRNHDAGLFQHNLHLHATQPARLAHCVCTCRGSAVTGEEHLSTWSSDRCIDDVIMVGNQSNKRCGDLVAYCVRSYRSNGPPTGKGRPCEVPQR